MGVRACMKKDPMDLRGILASRPLGFQSRVPPGFPSRVLEHFMDAQTKRSLGWAATFSRRYLSENAAVKVQSGRETLRRCPCTSDVGALIVAHIWDRIAPTLTPGVAPSPDRR
jgi:hypothetical protein